MDVAALDRLPEPEARERLTACCGAEPWVAAMLAERPWGDRERLFRCAELAWRTLGRDQLAEAIARHPRLGESAAAAAVGERERRWSEGEQFGAAVGDEATRDALARSNERYEQRFGHTFILCATGKSAAEMLAALEARLANDDATELDVTAEELRRITMLRLEKLLAEPAAAKEDA